MPSLLNITKPINTQSPRIKSRFAELTEPVRETSSKQCAALTSRPPSPTARGSVSFCKAMCSADTLFRRSGLCIYVCMYVCIYVYTYVYMHTYTHISIYTYKNYMCYCIRDLGTTNPKVVAPLHMSLVLWIGFAKAHLS